MSELVDNYRDHIEVLEDAIYMMDYRNKNCIDDFIIHHKKLDNVFPKMVEDLKDQGLTIDEDLEELYNIKIMNINDGIYALIKIYGNKKYNDKKKQEMYEFVKNLTLVKNNIIDKKLENV